jgi:hypothetical protein
MNLEKLREDLQKKDQRRQNTGGVRDLKRACSLQKIKRFSVPFKNKIFEGKLGLQPKNKTGL